MDIVGLETSDLSAVIQHSLSNLSKVYLKFQCFHLTMLLSFFLCTDRFVSVIDNSLITLIMKHFQNFKLLNILIICCDFPLFLV